MNYIKHLTGFFEKVSNDRQLNPTHISLYMSLFQFWNYNRFRNPISISRDEVMRISKISSKATYHKCLKALHTGGYIKYEPSYNPFKGSHVFLFNFSENLKPLSKTEKAAAPIFEPVDGQVMNERHTGAETAIEQVSEQAVVPSINDINTLNNSNNQNSSNLVEPEQKIEEYQFPFRSVKEKEKSSAKKEKEEMPGSEFNENAKVSSPAFADYNAEHTANSRQKSSAKKEEIFSTFADSADSKHERQKEMPFDIKNLKLKGGSPVDSRYANFSSPSTASGSQVNQAPELDDVLQYFQQQDYPAMEANKFFHYFKSIGWLVGGKTPMTDWKAAANNWMLNAPKFIANDRSDQSKQFNTSATKNYSEPL